MEKVTRTEYARRHGVHRTTIEDRIKSGAIPPSAIEGTGRDMRILVEAADKAWEKNKDPERALRLGKPKPDDREDWEKVDDEPQDDTPDHFVKYKSAKADKEELAVRKLQIEIDQKEGRLLDADEVRKTILKLVVETKTALLNIPGKIGPELLACHDLLELETKLTQEINVALESLQRVEIGK